MEFTDYVHERRPALMRFATVLTGQTWLADDLVADVLGRAYERWTRIAGLAEPHAYVRRMIVNEYLSWHRRRRRTVLVDDAGADRTDPAQPAEEHAERDAMMRRLDELPRKQRAAIVLRYYVGLSDADIADHLGCREVSVRSLVSRGIAVLRIALTEPEPTHHEEQAWTARTPAPRT